MNKQSICRITVENTIVDLLIGNIIENYDGKDKTSITHTHSYTELFVCISGKITISVENENYVVSAGNIAVIPPHVNHILKNVEQNGSCYSVGVMLSCLPNEKNVNLYKKLTELCHGKTPVLIHDNLPLCHAVSMLSSVSADKAYLYSLNIVFLLAEIAENNSEKINSGNNSFFIDCELDRISRLEYIINTEYMHKLTLSYVAKKMFISERQLMRIVKERYNMTFSKVINTLRLDTAVKLLEENSKPISLIAEESGFSSIEYFYRTFHNKFGMNPSKYRKNFLK